jgi:RND family efflux transporter MFP subunit
MVFPKKILGISFIVIVIAGLAFFFFLKHKPAKSAEKSSKGSTTETQKAEEASIPVKIAKVSRGDLVIKLKSPGEAVTSKKIKISAEVSGVIKSLNIEESKHVREGELLVVLDDEEYRLALETAKASHLKTLSELLLEKRFAGPEEARPESDQKKIQKARADYDRDRRLYQDGKMTREAFEKAGKDFEMALIESGEKKEEILAAAKGLTQAEVAVKDAQIKIEKTKIRAPFSGIVCDIKVLARERVTANQELFTLVNISEIQVRAKVLESEVGKIKVDREADLRFSAYPERVFKGKVKAISPIINPEDKTCSVIVDVSNPAEEIKPGMHAEVEIAAEIYKDRLLVPQEAILVRGGRKLVFAVEGGLAKWKYIDVGLENEDYAEILNGVKEGESVCIEGHGTLAHDARVRIEE